MQPGTEILPQLTALMSRAKNIFEKSIVNDVFSPNKTNEKALQKRDLVKYEMEL